MRNDAVGYGASAPANLPSRIACAVSTTSNMLPCERVSVPDAAWPLPRQGDLGAREPPACVGGGMKGLNECGLRRRARAQQRATDA